VGSVVLRVLQRGYFVRPTVFADVDPEMTIAQEEIFGPVLAVIAYETEEQAIGIANWTPYGLGGYVFTNDYEKGLVIGRQIRAGCVFLNGRPSNTAAPMGGYKQSGNGREIGVFGLEEYLEVKGPDTLYLSSLQKSGVPVQQANLTMALAIQILGNAQHAKRPAQGARQLLEPLERPAEIGAPALR
jgi:delta 1-pyrroline-5-carboxylate dehydrogenase